MAYLDDLLRELEERNLTGKIYNAGKSSVTQTSSTQKKKQNDYTEELLTILSEDAKKNGVKLELSDYGIISSDTFKAPIEDIAPVKKKEEADDGLLDFFQAGALGDIDLRKQFSDGYQFGDVLKTGGHVASQVGKAILGTAGDIGLGVVKGFASSAEGIADLASYGIAAGLDAVGKDDSAKQWRKNASENTVEEWTKGADEYLNRYSVAGRTIDGAAQGVGQYLALLGTGGVGKAAGLGAKAVSAITRGTLAASAAGSAMGTAYAEGATDGEAGIHGLATGGIEVLTEMLFGGLGKALNVTGFSTGLLDADDVLAKKVSGLFSSQINKNFAELGIKASAEGLEEVLSGIGQAISKKLTYMKEEELLDLVKDENLLEQFVVGATTSGFIQSGIIPGTSKGSLREANAEGRDFITGLNANEQTVIDKEVEKRIAAEEEQSGKKLTKKEISKITETVQEDMDKGYISIDTIEEALGGETYTNYKKVVDAEEKMQSEYDALGKKEKYTLADDARYKELGERLKYVREKGAKNELRKRLDEQVSSMVKDSRLAESFAERSRRGQSFEADLEQYTDEKQRAIVQKAVESGILNNTNRTREFVNMVSKIAADKDISFDFANNAKLKETGFAVEGKTVNGFLTKDGITVNIQSAKALNSVVGHEITHVLEGTELYTELQTAAIEYAKTKGDYQGRYDALVKMYESVEGADIDAELTADIVGEYLFTDSDFINNLSTNHRNVFQKIYDEIKYLLKVATAGSKEARELEKVKRAFEKAYRDGGNNGAASTTTAVTEDVIGDVYEDSSGGAASQASGGTKYSLVEDQKTIDFLENQEHLTVYKAMSMIDGKLYPPMASQTYVEEEYTTKSGEKKTKRVRKLKNPSVLGRWQQAEERTDIAEKTFDPKKGYSSFDLLKSNGKTTPAVAYNPYEHTSNIVLNDQFSEAYQRPELVTVEYEIPVSELTSGYKAQYAKDPVGLTDWKAGGVAQKLKHGHRDVYLTRWSKPVRVLSDAEVAQKYKELLDKEDGISVPWNVVTASLREELEKIGVPIDYSDIKAGSTVRSFEAAVRGDYEKPKKAKKGAKYSLNEVTEDGLTMTYVRVPNQNTPNFGSTYGQNIEPAGEYMSMDTMQGKNKIEGYEYGTIQFKKPLVLEHINTGETGWKKTVSDMYGGLTGKKLSAALIKDGYDAIVTYDEYGYNEIVNLNGKKLDNPQEGAKFSLSEDIAPSPVESYAAITEKQQELYQRERNLAERKREANNNPELLQAMDDFHSLFDEMRELLPKRQQGTATQAELDRIEEIKTLRDAKLQRVYEIQERLGLKAMEEEEAEIRRMKEELRVAADTAWKREGAEKENAAIAKAGVSSQEYFRKKALKAFKTTTNFNEAGYLLPDGKLLNFSGGERNHRYRDHREIGEIYEATQGAEALNRFLHDGNIRIMAESPGIDLASGVEPTAEQYAAIRKFVKSHGTQEGQFFVDFSDAEGHKAGNYAYEGRVNADRVINDIKYYYANGAVREQSEIGKFLSLSPEGARPTADGNYGNYNVYGEDIALEEDIAPVRQDIAPATASQNAAVQDAAAYEEPLDEESPYAEVDRLTEQLEEMEQRYEATFAADDYETAEALLDEMARIAGRVNELEGQLDADAQDRLASFEDADAPVEVEYEEEPEFERPVDTVTLPKTRVAEIAKAAQNRLGTERQGRKIGELVQKYSEGEIDRDDLFSEIKLKAGKVTEKVVLDELKDVQKWLRTAPLRVTPDIKSSFADYYTAIHKPNFSKIAFRANEGSKVDQYYEELKDKFPEFFPADIISPADQLQKIVEVANMDAVLTETRTVDNAQLWDAVDEIVRQVSEYRQSRNRLLQEKARKESLHDLLRNGDKYAPMEEDIAPVRADAAPAAETVVESTEPTTRKALHQRMIEKLTDYMALKGFDLLEVLKNAKNLSTFATIDNTPQRVMEKAFGYEAGQALADVTVNLAAQNETEGIRWLNTITNRENGLLKRLSDEYHIKPGSKESKAAQMYAEGFYAEQDKNGHTVQLIKYGDAELAKDFPDAKVQANIKGLARDPRIRQFYDETLDAINKSRARNLYPEIPRRENYFLHFREQEDTFSRIGLPFNPNDIRAKDLPTDLNGVTADLKPGQPYFASAKRREGYATTYDLLGGLEKYANAAKNQIYHIDDIQTLRAFRNFVADTFGQAHGLDGLDELTEVEQQERINEVMNSHLSTYAAFLNELANKLAGKTALIDRAAEGIIGRRGLTFFDTLNRLVGANMVGFNVSSSLTNFIAVTQAFAKTNKADFIKAFAQTVTNRVRGGEDSFTENSPVIIRRKGAEKFARTPWEKASDMGYVMMSVVDNLSTELIARTKFNELTKKGMSEQQAHIETDKWVSRLMGDRSLGQMPLMYNSKVLSIFTKFQLEVRNQLDAMFYDTIQEAKASTKDIENAQVRNMKKAAKITSTFVQLAVVQHLFGKAFESIAGYNPAFDIIEAIIKAFGWDDEEDDEDTVLDNLGQGLMSLAEDMPYSSLILDGGRVPISSALPIGQAIKGKDKYGNEKPWYETVAEAAPYWLLPGGYGQIKKTTQGLGMFDDDLPIAGSYTDSGNLRFTVEDTFENRVQAAVFGQWASSNARDYFDNERQSLKKNQIQELVDVDIPIREYWDYREGLNEQETLAEKFDYIAGLDLPIDKKNILINNVVDRKEAVDLTDYDQFADYEEFDFAVKNPEKYDFLQSVGVSVAQYNGFDDDTKDAYNWAYQNPEKYTLSRAVTDDVAVYRQYTKALNELSADKDAAGKSISGSRKAKVIDYLNGLDADYYAKLILFKMEYNADDTYNNEIIEYLNDRNDISFEEEVTILRELGFTVTADGTVRW